MLLRLIKLRSVFSIVFWVCVCVFFSQHFRYFRCVIWPIVSREFDRRCAKNDYNLCLSLFKTALVAADINWKFVSHWTRVPIRLFTITLDDSLDTLAHNGDSMMGREKPRAVKWKIRDFFRVELWMKHKYAVWNQFGCGRSSNGICAKTFFFLLRLFNDISTVKPWLTTADYPHKLTSNHEKSLWQIG